MTEIEELTALAVAWFDLAQEELQTGGRIVPRWAVIARDGRRAMVQVVSPLPRDPETRRDVFRAIVESVDATALLYLHDAWVTDRTTGKRTGEALSALILTERGAVRSMMRPYTREPWVFGDVETDDTVTTKYDLWGRRTTPTTTTKPDLATFPGWQLPGTSTVH